jgi:hypothetical protein
MPFSQKNIIDNLMRLVSLFLKLKGTFYHILALSSVLIAEQVIYMLAVCMDVWSQYAFAYISCNRFL